MANIIGTNATQTLNGTNGLDTIQGLGGSDRISGLGGDDTISGGDGSDTINGGDGDDTIFGHSAADRNPSSGHITASLLTDVGSGAVLVTGAPGDEGFVYALRKDVGDVIRIDTATGAQSTFLDIPAAHFAAGGERGVLGLAFHPGYEANGRFFVFLTNTAGNLEVREYARAGNPAAADPSVVETTITIPHPTFANHNGGALAFGPDGYLHVSTGDGGGANDPNGNAQNTNVLLGKILRIDVDGDDFPADPSRNYAIPDDNPFAGSTPGADEIWAYGLRNPWRISFDALTGDLYIGDVGQSAREEVNFEAAGGRGGLTTAGTTAKAGCRVRAPRRTTDRLHRAGFRLSPRFRPQHYRRPCLPRTGRRSARRLLLRRFRHRAADDAAHGERAGRRCDRAHGSGERRPTSTGLVVRDRRCRQSLRGEPDRCDPSARSGQRGGRRRRCDQWRRRQRQSLRRRRQRRAQRRRRHRHHGRRRRATMPITSIPSATG